MIKILACGKLKEKFYTDAAEEYLKRLSAYTKINVIQLPDESTLNDPSDREAEMIKDKEAVNIFKHIKDNEYVISLEIEGKKLSSEGFADFIERLSVKGVSDIVFVIGGSMGLSDKVKQRADLSLSFSDMTFPHQLMRVILLEQIYRAYKIIRKEPYHK